MPADYSSAAAALSISPSHSPAPPSASSPLVGAGDEDPEDDDDLERQAPPPWVRPRESSILRLGGRPYAVHGGGPGSQQQEAGLLLSAVKTAENAWTFFLRLPLPHKAGVVAAALALITLAVLALVYSHKIFAALGPLAKGWRDLPGGWVLVWLLIFVTAFPPVIGYSTAVTVSGIVFGFPLGWPIAATATVVGSTAAFVASRGILGRYVHGLVGADRRFVALGQVLRRDGLLVLTGVRFCPLPFSLSNGFLATIPSISPWSFAVCTALASPKLLVHVFIGSRLALLAERGDSMSAGDRAINYAGMLVGGLVGLAVGLLVYRRTMARAAELAREELADGGILAGAGGGRRSSDADGEEARLMMDPDQADADAAALMDDDDISLWATEDYEAAAAGQSPAPAPPLVSVGVGDGRYRDEAEDGRGGGGGLDAKVIIGREVAAQGGGRTKQ